MAFRIDTLLQGYEYRALVDDTFTDSDGIDRPYMQIVLENLDDNCSQSKVSVPSELHSMVRSLGIRRGMLVDMLVVVSAGGKYSKLQLKEIKRIYNPDSGEVEY